MLRMLSLLNASGMNDPGHLQPGLGGCSVHSVMRNDILSGIVYGRMFMLEGAIVSLEARD